MTGEYASALEGKTIKSVVESTKWDLVLEFDSGGTLHVYDAKWHIENHD